MADFSDAIQEKRYRSMQEHIRRAHPEHYIPKLPATEESFQLMINSPPSERPPPPPPQAPEQPGTDALRGRHSRNADSDDIAYGHERDSKIVEVHVPAPTRILEDAYPAAATAAVALAQLHNHRPDSDWDSELVSYKPKPRSTSGWRTLTLIGCSQDQMSDHETLRRPRMHSSVELPPIHNHINQDIIPPFHSPRPRELLPSIMSRSPPGRSSTLPPIQKRDKPTRPRKSSITKNERRPKHGRGMSKDHVRRLSIESRKASSAEPASAMGKRWEDLIEAATSANEADSDRDLTPVSFSSYPYLSGTYLS